MNKQEKTHKKNKRSILSIDKARARMRKRSTLIFVLAFIALFVLIVRITSINLKSGEEYTIKVLKQNQVGSVSIAYERGEILDTNGVVLATSTKVYNLILDGRVMFSDQKYVEPTIRTISECFGYDYSELLAIATERKDSSYIQLKKQMAYEEITEFLEKEEENDFIKGVWFEENYKRNYPYSTLASSVIGFTDANGTGQIGLEAYYDKTLTGTDGRRFTYTNSDNVQETVIKRATNGQSLVTTINYNVQNIVETKIEDFMKEYKPLNIGVIIMNPNNGEILAMADSGTFDCNNPRDISKYYKKKKLDKMSDEEQVAALNRIWRNTTISDGFEPGSTYKPFTISGALEESKIKKNDSFLCNGGEQVLDFYIQCHVHEGHGMLDVKGALAQSCNDSLMQIADKMGNELFSKYREHFGFNKYTNIDLPSESSCENIVKSAEDMDATDLATYSFGQNFKTTMIQLASSFSSLINGGYYYQPHVVKQILGEDGGVVSTTDKILVTRTVSADTSEFMKKSLRSVVEDGTGHNSTVEGYIISGKTGTAEKGDTKDENDYVLSFIGFAPYDDPQVVCYVTIDSPDVEDQGNSSCGPLLFRAIMTDVLPYLSIMPDAPAK